MKDIANYCDKQNKPKKGPHQAFKTKKIHKLQEEAEQKICAMGNNKN